MTIIEGSTHTSRARDAYDEHLRCLSQAQSMLSMLPQAGGGRPLISNKIIGDVVSAATDLMDKAKEAAEMMLIEVVD